MQPHVSVIIPTYNRLHYLQEALPSALPQTYSNFELIVCDDSRSDAIRDYVTSIGDPRIRYHGNPRNLGIALNTLSGFRAARGQLLSTLHDDDLWEPDFLEKLVRPFDLYPDVVVSFSDHHIIDG